MSLISQNAIPKDSTKKKKKRVSKTDEMMLLENGKEGVGEENDNGLGVVENPKKRRTQKEISKPMGIAEEKEMKKLENSLFGSLYSSIAFGKDDEEDVRDDFDDTSALFFSDRSANSVLPAYEEDVELGEKATEAQKRMGMERKPVWTDDEEEKLAVNIAEVPRLRKLRKKAEESVITASEYVSRLRAQHIKMNRGTDWARPEVRMNYSSSEDDDSDNESEMTAAHGYEDLGDAGGLLRHNKDLVRRNSKLLPGILEYSRLVDANMKDPSNSAVKSVQFHNNAQLLLVGGLDKTLRFFQVDGKKNEMIQSIFLEDCPIRKAAFVPDGSNVIISGRRKFAYSFDLINARVDRIGPLTGRDEKSLESFEVSPDSNTIAFLGNDGHILLVSTKTKELIGTLKMNGTVRSAAFTNNGQQLLTFGGDGRVYHWDLRTRSCFHIGIDEGCVKGTSLCVSPVGNLFATGSDTGIVNVYNREEFLGGKRKPLKAIDNLTTNVDFMKFNPDGRILAISSQRKKNSMKLIHIPTLTAFSNWPPPNQLMHYPSCVDFSPLGGFMAVGNAAGKVLLYKLHHYHQA